MTTEHFELDGIQYVCLATTTRTGRYMRHTMVSQRRSFASSNGGYFFVVKEDDEGWCSAYECYYPRNHQV